MGWRERDWAKTDEERARFLGSSSSVGPTGDVTPRPSGFSRRLSKAEIVLALLVVLPVLGYLVHREIQRHESPATTLQPSARLLRRLEAPPSKPLPPVRREPLHLPPSLRAGTYVTTSGTLATNVGGVVIVEARWGKGPWLRLATANATNGTFRVRYLLSKRGRVHVRIALPDGNYLAGSSNVT